MGWEAGIKAFWARPINPEPLVRAVLGHLPRTLVVIGLVLRLIVFLQNRSLWFDEMSLWGNIAQESPFRFDHPLTGDQLAPFGFLVIERMVAWVYGTGQMALRVVPLLAGMGALVLFSRLAARVLPERPALVALALFALSDDLIYYSSELKPYSVDVFMAVGMVLATVTSLGVSPTLRWAALMALATAFSPWWSFPSAFIVAGCGLVLVVESAAHGRRRDAHVWTMVGLAWFASFVVAYRASKAILTPYTTMYAFWDFAFLSPVEPGRWLDAAKASGILLEIFVNPLNLLAPVNRWLAIALPILLFAGGIVWLARRSPGVVLAAIAPVVLNAIASELKFYPLHGRLSLGLAPLAFLLIAAGTEWLWRLDASPSKLVYKVLLVLALAFPMLAGPYESLGRRPREFNAHGDLHANVFVQ